MGAKARTTWGFSFPTWPIKTIKTAVGAAQTTVKKIGQWAIVAINVLAVAFIVLALPVMGTMLAIEFGGDFIRKQSRTATLNHVEKRASQVNKDAENHASISSVEYIKFLSKLDKAWESSSTTQRGTWAADNHVLPEVQSWLGRSNKSLDPEWYKRLKK